jgi:hypothetical protein
MSYTQSVRAAGNHGYLVFNTHFNTSLSLSDYRRFFLDTASR